VNGIQKEMYAILLRREGGPSLRLAMKEWDPVYVWFLVRSTEQIWVRGSAYEIWP